MLKILELFSAEPYIAKSNEYAKAMRYKSIKSANTRNWTNNTDITNSHFVGKIGELHFAYIVALGISDFPEPSCKVGLYGDKGVDFSYNGITIDVKTCVNNGKINRVQYLKIPVTKIIADIYSLVVYYPLTNQCKYVGSVTAQEIRQECYYNSNCSLKLRDNEWYYWINEQIVGDNINKNIHKMLKKDIQYL